MHRTDLSSVSIISAAAVLNMRINFVKSIVCKKKKLEINYDLILLGVITYLLWMEFNDKDEKYSTLNKS